MKRILWGVPLVFFAAIALSGCGVAVVEDGETGVKADFGTISNEPLASGWHFYIPFTSWIEVWNVKTQELKENASVPSSEGLISTLDISVLYQIPKDKAVLVRRTIGRAYRETILEPYVREAIRSVASGYEVKALFSDKGRKEIGEGMFRFLNDKLGPHGIVVQDVLLRDVRLPEAFSQSITLKLRTEQEALQKEFELQKAKKDAEIEVARAEGMAKSNQIIADSIDPNYLKYLWIKAMAGSDRQVVYVPTEANLPILESQRWQQNEREPKSGK